MTSRVPPIANYYRLYTCDQCPNVHIVLFTEDNEPIAQMTMKEGQAKNLHEWFFLPEDQKLQLPGRPIQ